MHLLIKPSNASVKKAMETIKNVFIQLRGRPVGDLIKKLNPIIRGIGNYWSSQVAKKIFRKLDSYIWIKIRKHLKGLHNNKPFKWIFKKYFKPDYTGVSKDKWILTDPHDKKTQLFKMSWIPIVRHAVVKYRNSPDDGSLIEYFEKRDKKDFINDNISSRRMTKQKSKTNRTKSMLELYVVKATRTVPRRERGSNSSDLADKHTSTVLRGERSRNAPYLLD
ncbi:group II intron maturase-specific domain-containing protein [Clostridium estertheticum]|uniref:group II intron maturase-specific domain-containing protein n=1 Tax=Clostridium estertheticum TaxID=238834 RepID=UPI001CF315B2|nr:group II intron maturase-specific domain-containing protein [Clostridium estertheticum]MCB2342850.1 hypothetical protein [Clostridium estertheticum]